MEDSSYKFQKLKGSSNWEIWSLRASAVLAQRGYIEAMTPATKTQPEAPNTNQTNLDAAQLAALNATQQAYQEQLEQYQQYTQKRQAQSFQAASLIRLMIEDGPLLQTRNINDAEQLWNRLMVLYQPSGFSSEFLISRELFSTTLGGCKGSIEDYLTRIRQLTDELSARNLAIPNKVIAAYTLSNLGPEWENTVAIISQTYRSQNGDIDLTALFSQLIDESRRRKALYHLDEMVMTTQNRPIRPKCPHCRMTNHTAEKCWIKHPHLRPKKAKKPQKGDQLVNNQLAYRDQSESRDQPVYMAEEEQEIALHSSTPEDIGTWYLDSAATSHISAYKGLF